MNTRPTAAISRQKSQHVELEEQVTQVEQEEQVKKVGQETQVKKDEWDIRNR